MGWWPCASAACGDGCINSGCDGSFYVDCFDYIYPRWERYSFSQVTWDVSGGRGRLFSTPTYPGGGLAGIKQSYGFFPGVTDPDHLVVSCKFWSVGDKVQMYSDGSALAADYNVFKITVDWITGDVICSSHDVTTPTTVPSAAISGATYKITIDFGSFGTGNTRSCFYVNNNLIHTEVNSIVGFHTPREFGILGQGNVDDQIAEYDDFCYGSPGNDGVGCPSASANLANDSDFRIRVNMSNTSFNWAEAVANTSSVSVATTEDVEGITAAAEAVGNTSALDLRMGATTGTVEAIGNNAPIRITVNGTTASAKAIANTATVNTEGCYLDFCVYRCTASSWVLDTDNCAIDCTCGAAPSSPCGEPEEGNTENVDCVPA